MIRKIILITVLVLSTFLFPGPIKMEAAEMSELKISSPAFSNMGKIPSKYTCEGEDVNPPLLIENIPEGTKSLALIVEDPDAPVGIWVHWLVWNINPEGGEIKENSLPEGAVQGENDFRKQNFGGPCPPSGTHRYFFKLYALDTTLDLPPGSTKAKLEDAISGHILGKAEIIGMYRRSRGY